VPVAVVVTGCSLVVNVGAMVGTVVNIGFGALVVVINILVVVGAIVVRITLLVDPMGIGEVLHG
jgi:hypothetical protein